MSKMRIPTPIDKLEDKLNQYAKIFPDLNDSLQANFLKIKELLQTGILIEDSYDLFIDDYKNFSKSMSLNLFRDDYISKYGFFLVSEQFINTAKELFNDNKILEVGSGTGFLSYCLQNEGLNIVPTEKYLTNNHYGFSQSYTNILEVDSIEYLKQNQKSFDTILMSWPNYDNDFAYNILKNMVIGQKLIYIGEGYGGCTGDDQFFNKLEESTKLIENETDKFRQFSWFGIHDRVKIYEKIKK